MGGGKPIIRVAFNHPRPPRANKIFKKFEEIFVLIRLPDTLRRTDSLEGRKAGKMCRKRSFSAFLPSKSALCQATGYAGEFRLPRKQGLRASWRAAGGGKGIANCKLGIANCELRISGLRPGVIYFASKNWAERPLAFKPAGRNPHSGNANGVPSFSPGKASAPREGCKALLRGNELPWEPGNKSKQPQRGCIPRPKSRAVRADGTPSGFMIILERIPRVAFAASRLRQPWAG